MLASAVNAIAEAVAKPGRHSRLEQVCADAVPRFLYRLLVPVVLSILGNPYDCVGELTQAAHRRLAVAVERSKLERLRFASVPACDDGRCAEPDINDLDLFRNPEPLQPRPFRRGRQRALGKGERPMAVDIAVGFRQQRRLQGQKTVPHAVGGQPAVLVALYVGVEQDFR